MGVYIGGIFALGVLGWLVVIYVKKTGRLEAEKKIIETQNAVVKEQLDIASESVTPEEAYTGLKEGPKK